MRGGHIHRPPDRLMAQNRHARRAAVELLVNPVFAEPYVVGDHVRSSVTTEEIIDGYVRMLKEETP